MSSSDLTICSVYHSHEAKRLLELNYDFVQNMNPRANIRWIVADNTPPDFPEKLGATKKFIIVPGADDVEDVPTWAWGSYRHARALAHTIGNITTRFALFLDIDFYIVIPSWIAKIPQYMQTEGLHFFGVPWHPDHKRKWRYFPSPHTLFVDMENVERDKLNFEPNVFLSPTRHYVKKIRKKVFSHDWCTRFEINSVPDTGYPIYERFHDEAPYECPQPVFRGQANTLDRVLPDWLSLVPKRDGYFTRTSFHDLGYPDCMREGWEEFIWQGKPFGFHIRGSHKLENDLDGNLMHIRNTLDAFLPHLS